ncbi:MAG: MvdC/MvdD family ATP grasp protein [Patescibacteria group bacterium]
MILIVTNKFDPHADAVIAHLKRRGEIFLRFNTEDFPSKIKISLFKDNSSYKCHLDLPVGAFDVSKVSACWYRRPDPPQISEINSKIANNFAQKESLTFLSYLWNSLNCFWINHPQLTKPAENKIKQLNIASNLGLKIPHSLITNDPEKALQFYKACDGNVVNKVISRGEIKNEEQTFFLYTNKIDKIDLQSINHVRLAPTFFQEYIQKKVEIRITIVGKKIFSVEIHSQSSDKTKIDWRHYDFDKVPHFPHELPKEIREKCLALLEKFNLNFGTIDMVLTPKNEYVFLELNPNGQWLWLEHLTGLPISEAIANLLSENNIQK